MPSPYFDRLDLIISFLDQVLPVALQVHCSTESWDEVDATLAGSVVPDVIARRRVRCHICIEESTPNVT